MTRPTIILSDTHLGDPRASTPRVADLVPIIAQAGHLIINGDVAELQHPKLQAQAARQVLDLQATCESMGVELTLLSGNHDAFLEDQRYLTLHNEHILVTHGDVLHPAVVPWSDAAKWFREKSIRTQNDVSAEPMADLSAQLEIARFIGHHEFIHSLGKHTSMKTIWMRPHLLISILWYWFQAPRYAAKLLKLCLPQAKVLIFGHSHRPGIWQRHGKLVINTGSFHFPGHPRAVVLDHDTLAVHRIERNTEGLLDLVQPALQSFALPPTQTNTATPKQLATNAPSQTTSNKPAKATNQTYLHTLANKSSPQANTPAKQTPIDQDASLNKCA